MKTEKVFIDNLDLTINYLIGQNAKDNFAVIDEAIKTDIWIHAEKESSCHIVALLPDEHVNNFTDKEIKEIVKKGAELCKFHTKKLSELKKRIPFIYTEVKNVSKTKTAGLVITTHTEIISV